MSDTVVTLLVTYHEQRAEVPDFWKDAVTTAAAAAKRVILMTVRLQQTAFNPPAGRCQEC
jgi:hypothetical protein